MGCAPPLPRLLLCLLLAPLCRTATLDIGGSVLVGDGLTLASNSAVTAPKVVIDTKGPEQALELKSSGDVALYLDGGRYSLIRHHKNGVAEFEMGLDPDGTYYLNQNAAFGKTQAAIAIKPDSQVEMLQNKVSVNHIAVAQSLQVGNEITSVFSGSTSTANRWEVVLEWDGSVSSLYVEMRMAFSHCGGGCHTAMREWKGFLNAYVAMFAAYNHESNLKDGGSWLIERPQNNQIKLVKEAGLNNYGGPVNIRITARKGISVVS